MRVLRVALSAAAAVLAAGCSAGSAQQAAPASHGSSSPAAARVTRDHAVPGCSTATAPARALGAAGTSLEHVPGNPFAVVATSDGHWSFVSLVNSIAVLRSGGQSAPSLIRTISVPGRGAALGEALTRDGRYLLVADTRGAEVIDVARAENGSPHAVLGSLASTGGGEAIEVALSADDRYAFVSLEGGEEIAVFSLQRALAHGFGPSDFVGDIPVGQAPVGLAVSPDGQWLYATSQFAANARPSGGGLGSQGTLQVISIRRAETDPGRSVVTTVNAGCQPVRVITSADGSAAWVTARASDTLLGFSAARLRADPARSLIGAVRVGEAPVGLALVRNGARIVVADSNRFNASGASSSLAVVNVAAALAGKPALLGYLRAGGFPRQMALEPGGRTLLVTNFNSSQLESVTVADLP